MSQEITLPTGRLLWANEKGDLFTPVEKDFDGNPLVYRDGPKKGQPRFNFRFGYAVAKTPGVQGIVQLSAALQQAGHTLATLQASGWTLPALQQQGHVTVLPAWTGEPDWGMKIYNEALAKFRNGETLRPDFSWKITDGDSAVVGKGFRGRPGTAPKDKEGHPGHWVFTCASDFAPNLYVQGTDGKWLPTDRKDVVKCGHFIQVSVNVAPNSGASPGVYINHQMIAYRAWGPEIVLGRDANEAGFGKDALPPGASAIPQGIATLPVPAAMLPPPGQATLLPAAGGAPIPIPAPSAVSLPLPVPQAIASALPSPTNLPPPTAVTPHTAILTLPTPAGVAPVPGMAIPPPPAPPAPVPAGPQLSPAAKAAGYTLAAFQAAGWSEAQMRAAGHIL